MDELVKAIGKGERELQKRMRFAEDYRDRRMISVYAGRKFTNVGLSSGFT